MTVVGSALDLLVDEDEKHTRAELVEKAKNALKNQTKIVDDFLKASRINAKRRN